MGVITTCALSHNSPSSCRSLEVPLWAGLAPSCVSQGWLQRERGKGLVQRILLYQHLALTLKRVMEDRGLQLRPDSSTLVGMLSELLSSPLPRAHIQCFRQTAEDGYGPSCSKSATMLELGCLLQFYLYCRQAYAASFTHS